MTPFLFLPQRLGHPSFWSLISFNHLNVDSVSRVGSSDCGLSNSTTKDPISTSIHKMFLAKSNSQHIGRRRWIQLWKPQKSEQWIEGWNA